MSLDLLGGAVYWLLAHRSCRLWSAPRLWLLIQQFRPSSVTVRSVQLQRQFVSIVRLLTSWLPQLVCALLLSASRALALLYECHRPTSGGQPPRQQLWRTLTGRYTVSMSLLSAGFQKCIGGSSEIASCGGSHGRTPHSIWAVD